MPRIDTVCTRRKPNSSPAGNVSTGWHFTRRPFEVETHPADEPTPAPAHSGHDFTQYSILPPSPSGQPSSSAASASSPGPASSSPLQLQKGKGGGRRRRKSYKNDRKKRAFQKRDFEGGFPERSSLPEPKVPYDRPSQQERDKERQKKKTERRKPVRDDDELHFREPEGETIRVYRAEVQSFNPKFSHVHVKDGRARVYNPPPDTKGKLPVSKEDYKQDEGGYYTEVSGTKRYLTKLTPKKDESNPQKFSRKFLRSRKNRPQGTMNWQNFGEPHRALEFYHQKSQNPTEQRKGNVFAIKSFEVPSGTYRAIRNDTVHERQRKKNPTKAINVDREAPNQFGLQQAHVELLNEMAIPGSARVEKPAKLAKRVGFTPIYSPPRKTKKNKPKKSKRPQLGRLGDPIKMGLEDYHGESQDFDDYWDDDEYEDY